jgi:predicted pyridoxine 5'-phosphate oxidase superfamily flavin-nucleotide-binding protein
MAYGFLDILSTPGVKAAQAANGSGDYWSSFGGHRESAHFTGAEAAFIAARDSFYLASIAENGWPYVQHRGGPPGFLRVLDEKTLGFADFRGNRQYISVGNVGANDKVALMLMDYAGRHRLKVLGHAEIKDLSDDPALAAKLAVPGYKAKIERAILIHLEAFDWNCPQHITPRYSEAELGPALAPVRERLAALETENRDLRARLAAVEPAQSVS